MKTNINVEVGKFYFSINDGFVTYTFPLFISRHYSIEKVAKKIYGAFGVPEEKGEIQKRDYLKTTDKMPIAEAKKKIKHLNKVLSEWATLNMLILSMQKAEKQGLEINKLYLINAIKHRDKMLDEFDNLLK